MSETHEEPVVAKTSPTIGEQLKQAREAKNYTVAEVAAQLRLTKDIISHMEEQEWDKLNGRTYARGYFANYVKFLGLPYEEMLAVFNLEYTASEPSVNLRQHSHSANDKPFPWFMLALVAIVLVVIWLAYQQWQQTQALQQSSAGSDEQAGQVEQNDLVDSVVEPLDSDNALTQQLSTETEPTAPVTQESLSATADELGLSDDNLDEINAAEQVNSADTAIADESGQAVTGTAGSQAETEPVQAVQSATLRLNFSGECWVEVTNADAEVLVSQVMQAQDSLELNADQPLNVLLGRADAATVFFNNEQVDLKPYTQGDVARLTLGVES